MRFSLSSLFVAVMLLALTLVALNQYRQSSQIRELSARLGDLDDYAKVQSRINELLETLNPDDDDDLETFRLVRRLLPSIPTPLLPGEFELPDEFRHSQQQLIDVDGKPGGLEMLSLSFKPMMHPSRDYCVNVLYNGRELVDVMIRKRSSRYEHLNVEFVDYNGDAMMDLVINCRTLVADPSEILRYEATPKGFVLDASEVAKFAE